LALFFFIKVSYRERISATAPVAATNAVNVLLGSQPGSSMMTATVNPTDGKST
jgi:aspartate ammonia-lyase